MVLYGSDISRPAHVVERRRTRLTAIAIVRNTTNTIADAGRFIIVSNGDLIAITT